MVERKLPLKFVTEKHSRDISLVMHPLHNLFGASGLLESANTLFFSLLCQLCVLLHNRLWASRAYLALHC